MDVNAQILIVDPVMLFREGLSRIVREAGFEPVWCSDEPPAETVASGKGSMSPVLIIGSILQRAAWDIAQVKRYHPTAITVLLVGSDVHDVHDRGASELECGADTIISRDSSVETLIGTLKLVKAGVSVISSDLMAALLRDRSRALPESKVELLHTSPIQAELPSPLSNLSAREFSVLYHLLDGLPNKEIARRLNLSDETIKVHVKAILRKAHMKNRTQVAMWASRQGFRAKHQPMAGSVEQSGSDSVIRTNGVGPGYQIELAA